MLSDFTATEKIMLQVLDKGLSATYDNINNLESKARYNFTMMNAIAVAFILINVQIIGIDVLEKSTELFVLLLLFFVIYLAVIGLALKAMWPELTDLAPVNPTNQTIDGMLDSSPSEFLNELFSQYVDIHETHEILMSKKGIGVTWGFRLISLSLFVAASQLVIYFT